MLLFCFEGGFLRGSATCLSLAFIFILSLFRLCYDLMGLSGKQHRQHKYFCLKAIILFTFRFAVFPIYSHVYLYPVPELYWGFLL